MNAAPVEAVWERFLSDPVGAVERLIHPSQGTAHMSDTDPNAPAATEAPATVAADPVVVDQAPAVPAAPDAAAPDAAVADLVVADPAQAAPAAADPAPAAPTADAVQQDAPAEAEPVVDPRVALRAKLLAVKGQADAAKKRLMLDEACDAISALADVLLGTLN